MKNKNLLIAYKSFFGLLGFSAIITEIATILERGRFNPANFFSYFTIEVNILIAVILLLSSLATACGKNRRLDAWRGAIAVYALIVGLGFSVLLAGLENTDFTAVAWDNIVLHYIMPVAMFIDLLIDRPKSAISFKRGLTWLIFPIIYVSYSLTRGAVVGWYPYAFLNPNHDGYGAVAITIIGIVIMALALTWVVSKLSGKKRTIKQTT
ncbi:MAG: Pr6Pr family membrane protein [bacterium]|nr:Pr6Pr family membrane protein [bacterium]